MNIVEKTFGVAPESIGDSSLPENDEETKQDFKTWKSPSCLKIKFNQNETLNFDLLTAKVNKIR